MLKLFVRSVEFIRYTCKSQKVINQIEMMLPWGKHFGMGKWKTIDKHWISALSVVCISFVERRGYEINYYCFGQSSPPEYLQFIFDNEKLKFE